MKAHRRLKAGKLSVGMPSSRDEAILNASGRRVASMQYSFASDGGAVGTYSSGRIIPAGAIVTGLHTDEISAITGNTSMTIRAGSVALSAALDETATAGIQAPALAGSVAGIKLAVDSELNVVFAGTAVTAGQIRVYVSYILPTDLSMA